PSTPLFRSRRSPGLPVTPGRRPGREAERPGLHGERTVLAWIRTAVILVGGGIAGLDTALRHGAPPPAPACFTLTLLAGAVLLTRTGVRYRRTLRAGRAGARGDATADARLAWLGTLAAAAGALLCGLGAVPCSGPAPGAPGRCRCEGAPRGRSPGRTRPPAAAAAFPASAPDEWPGS